LDFFTSVLTEKFEEQRDEHHEYHEVTKWHHSVELNGDVGHILLQPHAPQKSRCNELHSEQLGHVVADLVHLDFSLEEALEAALEDDCAQEGNYLSSQTLLHHLVEVLALICEQS